MAGESVLPAKHPCGAAGQPRGPHCDPACLWCLAAFTASLRGDSGTVTQAYGDT